VLYLFIGHSYAEIEDNENDLTDEEPVVYNCVYKYRKSKETSSFTFNKLFYSNEKKREENDNIVKMIEEDVVDHKTGKSVEQGTGNSKVSIFHETFEIEVGEERSKRKLKYKQRSHQIGEPSIRERQSKPEKRTKQQIKAIGTDEICTEISVPIPENITASYSAVSELVKGNLLDIIVAVESEDTLIDYDRNKEHKKRDNKSDSERLPMAFFLHRLIDCSKQVESLLKFSGGTLMDL